MEKSPGEVDEIFNRHWRLYRKVIDCNYMDHREIAGAIYDHWKDTTGGESMGKVLDLGCGDVEVPGQVIEKFGFESFTGVDSSSQALQEAAKRPMWDNAESRWIESDLRDFFKTESGKYDTIFSGFAIHHLTTEEKDNFLRNVREVLVDRGMFYFFDVFLLDSLARETSIDCYMKWIQEDWSEITRDEFALIDDHVRSSDFPEELSWALRSGEKAGFHISGIRLPTRNRFHHLFALSFQ